MHYKFIAFNCYKSKRITNINPKTPFGQLCKSIRINTFLSRKTHPVLQDPPSTMSPFLFKGLKQKWLLKGPAVKPIIPLEVEKPEDPDDDKSKFVSMEVKNRVDGKTTFKMHLRLFEEGSPQQWLDLLHDVKIVWTQNGLNKPNDRVCSMRTSRKRRRQQN